MTIIDHYTSRLFYYWAFDFMMDEKIYVYKTVRHDMTKRKEVRGKINSIIQFIQKHQTVTNPKQGGE